MEYRISEQLLWTWSMTKTHRFKILLYILFGIAGMAMSLSFVYWSKHAVDIATRATSGKLFQSCAWIVVCMVLIVAFDLVSSWIGELVKAEMTIRLQNVLIDSQMMATWQAKKRWHTGDLLVRIQTDCAELVQMLSVTFPSFCVTCIQLVGALVFLWVMDPMLALMVLFISPLFILSKLYYRKLRMLSKAVKQAESRLGTVMQENLKLRLLIRSLNMIEVRTSKLLDSQSQIFCLKVSQLKFSVYSRGVLRLTFSGGYLLAFLWGIYRLHGNLISFGTLAAFLQLVGKIQGPVLVTIAFVPTVIRCITVVDRLMELYRVPMEPKEKPVRLDSPIQLRFDHLSFCYEDREVIKDISMQVNSNVPTAIVGATGKGKTTLIRLMLALLEPQKGTLTIRSGTYDGKVSVATRCNFSYVPQGNTLFSGTVRENLLHVCPAASDADIKRALSVACADFVYSLPHGIDTFLGESGHGLSEGQAQRIAIARAVLQDGSIWLFDEATSALDAATSERLVKRLFEAGKDKVLIFVTHNQHLMNACSQVIMLN